jgi:hypothetical protein
MSLSRQTVTTVVGEKGRKLLREAKGRDAHFPF